MLWSLSQSRWIEWVERTDPGSCESEICRWPNEPRSSRNAVEVPYCMGLVWDGHGRGILVGGASYESELERGRDVPSSWPRVRRTLYAVEVRCLCCGLIVSFFFIVGCGYPYPASTDNNICMLWVLVIISCIWTMLVHVLGLLCLKTCETCSWNICNIRFQ
jgi:hypothetical protein